MQLRAKEIGKMNLKWSGIVWFDREEDLTEWLFKAKEEVELSEIIRSTEMLTFPGEEPALRYVAKYKWIQDDSI